MKDIISKGGGGGGRRVGGLGSIIMSGVKAKKEVEGRLEMERLRNMGFYVRQAELIWQYLQKTELDKIDFQGEKGGRGGGEGGWEKGGRGDLMMMVMMIMMVMVVGGREVE